MSTFHQIKLAEKKIPAQGNYHVKIKLAGGPL